MSIIFKASDHSYTSIEDDAIIWTSVTSIVSNFKEAFDAKGVAEKVSKSKKSKWYGLTSEEILEAWNSESKRAMELGTFYHNQREADLCSFSSIERDGKALPIFTPIEKEGVKYAPNQKLDDGVYPEHMVYLKSAGICGQSDLVEVVNGKIYITDYKGLCLNTEIPTVEGFKLMKNLTTSDIIFDGEGKPTKIKNLSDIHYNPCYKITFDNGDTIIADHEHKWVISKRLQTNKYKENEFTTEELYTRFKKEYLKINCVSIHTPEVTLPIDPYVLGVWLGDGSSSTGVITNMTNAVWKEIEKKGYFLGDDISQGGCGKAQLRTVYDLRTALKELNLLNNKHIPDIYLRSSFQQRLDLLRGFMDADGYLNKSRKRCVMRTTKEWQANAIKDLISSLGWKATIINTTASGFGKNNLPCFDVTFRPVDVNPFLARNHNYFDIIKNSSDRNKFRTIKAIEPIETVPTRCIEVESSTHCYLATRSYIKTHNTNKEIKTESYVNWEGISKKMLAPVNHLDDCSFNHYALQLSIYMYIMIKHNPKLEPGQMFIHHIIFEQESEDKHGYPIYKKTPEGDPIVESVIPIEVPYLKEEVISIVNWLKDNRHLLKKK